MASSSLLKRRSQKAAAFGIALVVHVVLLVILTQVRPIAPAAYVPEPDFGSGPPVDVGLFPEPGGEASGEAGAAPGSVSPLRRLGGGSASSTPAPVPSSANGLRGETGVGEPAPAPSQESLPTPQTVSPSAELRAEPAPAAPPTPPETAPPTLALRPSIETAPALPAARPVARPDLRGATSLPELAPETPPPTIAARPPLLQANPTVAAKPAARPDLRPAPTLPRLAEEAPPPTLAARPPPLQANPNVTATNRPPPRLETRSAPSLALAPEAPPPTLAPRLAPLQSGPVVTAARPLARPDLRPSQAPALALAPEEAPGAAPTQRPGAAPAGGLATTGQGNAGQGGQGQAGAGRAGAAQASAGAGGAHGPLHPGCATEDLILLTPAEKVRCRNEIDAFNARRANRNATEETARRLQFAKDAPHVDGMAPETRAYFDSVAAANDAVEHQINGGAMPGLACNLGALFGNGDKSLPAQKIKIPGVPCVFVPPVGVLTEETRASPP